MHTKTQPVTSLLTFTYLPSFANYILTYKLEPFVLEQIRLCREVNIPLLKLFEGMTEEQLIAFSMKTTGETLQYLAANKADEQIQNSLKKWVANELPGIDRDWIEVEDITLIGYIRKQAFMHFMPGYCRNTEQMLDLIREIDLFVQQSEAASSATYIALLRNRIEEQSHFNQQITNTSPGIIYLFDLTTYTVNFANKKAEEVLGYTSAQMNAMGSQVLTNVIHPDDVSPAMDLLSQLRKAKEGQVTTNELRLKTPEGSYQWMRNYVAIFRRDEAGVPIEVIGIVLNIQAEKEAHQKLEQSERQLIEAQEVAGMGSFDYDLVSDNTNVSQNLLHIFEIPVITKLQDFLTRVHPDDRNKVTDAIKASLQTGLYECEYRYLGKNHEKTIWSRGKVLYDKEHKPLKIRGTVQDVTERQKLINQLKQTESLYKQAEVIANMGNWIWRLADNKIEWTDQLYKIYGLQPQSEQITIERFLSFVHPNDRPALEESIKRKPQLQTPDFTFRIIANDGKQKTLRSIAQLQLDENGRPISFIGTEQDITEREQLLVNLRHSENLYKQAETLAHIGSWSWDMDSNRVEWTDELYRIFGLEPQSEVIDFEKYTSFLYPEDKERVMTAISDAVQTGTPYEFAHRIICRDGAVRTVQSHGEVLINEQGKTYKLIGTAQDITERQELINKLQESEKLYKQAQTLSKMGNFAWDLKTNTVFWSEEVFEIYGFSKDKDLLFQDAFDPILPEYKQQVQNAIEATIADKKGRSVSYAIQPNDGVIKHLNLETDVLLDYDGSVAKIIGTAQDITERQNLIVRLQESEMLYKQAQSIAQLGNWTFDLKTKEFIWSDEMFRIYGIAPTEKFTEKEWVNFIHPDDREEVLSYLDECIRTKQPYNKQHRIILRDGTIKVLHRKGELILDHNGEPVRMIGTTQDITQQHRIQQELEENQNFIQKIADATPSIIAAYNVHTGKYLFVNQGLKKLLGYDAREVMQGGVAFFTTLIHPDDISPLMEKNRQAMHQSNLPENQHNNDLVVEFTYRMKHQNGAYRWFHTYGTIFDRNSKNEVEHVLNISLDITEQITAEQKIIEQERFIQQIADASPTILYLYDVSSNRFGYINKEVYYVLGYEPEEILETNGQFIQELYHTDDWHLLPERKNSSKKFQHEHSMMQYECRMKSKDGVWCWLLVREIVFKKEDGKVVQILGAALDITKRKEMEKTLLQNSFQLEQSNASLEEFAYVASHDLKEPLRKISTFGDRLFNTQMQNLTDDGKVYLKKIVEASQRMQTMINDLLSISMISGDQSFQTHSLNAILEDVKQALEAKIEQINAVIEADPLPEVKIVPSQFRQLFQNLLSNSLKFVREGVQPVVRIKHSYISPEEVAPYNLAKSSRYHKIEFIDNGIGFEEEYAGKIFAIFQRLHGRSEYEGTGIGLAICKKIVEHHNGVIYASGKSGGGATFTIILPAS